MTTVDSISPCTSMALPIGARSLPISSIGPIITSYLTERPSELKVCGGPCPGPRTWRNVFQSGPLNGSRCMCDGNGFCFWSRDIGRFRTLHCHCCVRNCRDKPVAKWREDAFTVLTVLTLRQSVPPLGEEELARRFVQAQAAFRGALQRDSCFMVSIAADSTGGLGKCVGIAA